MDRTSRIKRRLLAEQKTLHVKIARLSAEVDALRAENATLRAAFADALLLLNGHAAYFQHDALSADAEIVAQRSAGSRTGKSRKELGFARDWVWKRFCDGKLNRHLAGDDDGLPPKLYAALLKDAAKKKHDPDKVPGLKWLRAEIKRMPAKAEAISARAAAWEAALAGAERNRLKNPDAECKERIAPGIAYWLPAHEGSGGNDRSSS